MPLTYHAGQIEVQSEANTRELADQMAHWVGPVAEFAVAADLVLLVTETPSGELAFTALSGAAPLVEVASPGRLRLPGLSDGLPGGLAGGLVINLGQLRRARINGRLSLTEAGAELEAHEVFTLCRKYMAPSLALADEHLAGPTARERIDLHDSWLTGVVATAETAFLASVSPEGQPDVAHRGGLPGFLRFDAASGTLRWPEFIGDGVLKSAGNVRASSTATMLVPDLQTGNAVELCGRASYRTLRTMKQARLEALEQHKNPYPVQGEMTLQVASAYRLTSLFRPRRRIEQAERVTSRSRIAEQAPR
jgi:hypothetical protein